MMRAHLTDPMTDSDPDGPNTSAKGTFRIDSPGLVNKTILNQLTAISQHVDKLE